MISPTRGIKQGDPLSPYLFLFCAEGLNAILKRVKDNDDIHGFSICRRGPKLAHLFYENDCLLFCRSTLEECDKIKELQNIYEVASGQMVNKGKTTLFFSKNTAAATQEEIKVSLGIPTIQHYEKYLSLPPLLVRTRKLASHRLKNAFGRKCKDGRRNCYLKPERKSCLRQ